MTEKNASFPKKKVVTLLEDKDAEYFGEVDGKMVWIHNDVTTIKLPKGNQRVDWEILENIAEQLSMSSWDLDYWLGEN